MWQRSAIESNLSLLLWESVSLLLATTVSVLSVYFFFKASGSQTYWERKYIKKRNPQTRLEAQIKMKREMERGGEKRGGISPIFFGEVSHCLGCLAMFQGFN